MIRQLRVSGFKRFAECSLALAPLTVLTGTNGAGKTSVLQALLLAREASRSGAEAVRLNGPYGLELGAAQDVLNLHTAVEHSEVTIALEIEEGVESRYVLDASEESLLYLPVKERPPVIPWPLGGSDRDFTYLCAERLGPRDVLRASALPASELGVGVQGEYCAQVLSLRGLQEKVNLARRHPTRIDGVDSFLKYQVEVWLSNVVRPVEIDTIWFPNTSMTALRFRSPGGEWVRAPNMGFGVSYALPIVLAGLGAPTGSILIVENPEAHLHPAGQSRIGVFLAHLAADGVQVVLETHSDHVLNGIRRAIGEHRVLDHGNAIVHFFDMEAESKPTIAELRFTEVGGLSDWPSRFFDQFQLDVAALARVRRPRPR